MTSVAPPSARETASPLRSHRSWFVSPTAAVAYAVVVWYLVALTSPRLPVPHEVLLAAVEILREGDSYPHLWASARRVLLAFVGAGLGVFLGVAMGWFLRIGGLLKPLTVIGLALPEAVTVMVVMVIFGFTEASLVLALILSVMPYSMTQTMTAVKSLENQLFELGDVLGVSAMERWRHIIVPQLMPSLFAAARIGFAISWKFTVVAEAIAVSDGVGSRMVFSFLRLQSDMLIAWALIFASLMWAVELLVFSRIEKHVFRWRSEGRSATSRSLGAGFAARRLRLGASQ